MYMEPTWTEYFLIRPFWELSSIKFFSSYFLNIFIHNQIDA